MNEIKKPLHFPMRLLLLIILSTFIVETLFMWLVLPFLDSFDPLIIVVLNSTFLVAALFPVLYFFHLRPMETQISQRERAEAVLQEVNKRIRVEKAHREAEERLRLQASALESAANGILITNQDGIIQWVNPAFTTLTGYVAEEAVGQTPGILKSGEHNTQFYNTLWGTIQKGQVWIGEMTNRRKDGTRYVCEQTITPVRDGTGEISYFIGIQQDITERKRVEEELRVSEQNFRNLAEKSPNMIFINREGRVLYANEACEMIMGYRREELYDPDFDFLRLIVPETREVVRENLRLHQEGHDIPPYEYQLITKDGRRLYALHTTRLISYGGQEAILGIITDLTERVKNRKRIERQLNRLAALRQIDIAITSTTDIKIALDVLLTHAREQLEADAADVLLYDPHLKVLEFSAGVGFQTDAFRQVHMRVGQGHAGKAVQEQRIVRIPDLRVDQDPFSSSPSFTQESLIAYCGVPLFAKGEIKGVLEIYHRYPFEPDQEWLDFLETLSHQAALAIDSITSFNDLQRSNMELSLAYESTLEGWARALSLRDDETEEHTRRVTRMTVNLAETMGVAQEELTHIRRGAILHDIGKLGVPDQVLLKPGPLDEDEWELMRLHPVLAYELLSPISYLRPTLDVPYHHHEKWDGSGYPQGLEGTQIPFAARIFAVVDVWDALSSDRPYRGAWQPEKVTTYMHEQKGKHFDPDVVDTFLELLEDESWQR